MVGYWDMGLISAVKFTVVIWWDVKSPARAPFAWPHYTFEVVNPLCAMWELSAPAVQSHLPKLIFLTFMKMHETKLKFKKKNLFLSLLEYDFPLFAVSTAFYLKFEPATFMKFPNVTMPVNTVEWLHVSDPWWHEVTFCLLDVSCLLLDPYKDVCLYYGAQICPFLFPCPFSYEAFLHEFDLGGQTPWWGRLPFLVSGISFLFGLSRLQFPFWWCLFIQKWGIPSSQPSTIPAFLHASLSPTVIPSPGTALGYTGEEDLPSL